MKKVVLLSVLCALPYSAKAMEGTAEALAKEEAAMNVERANQDLMAAITNNDLDGARKALDRGADVNYADIDGRTPLTHASGLSNSALVQLLLKHGADANRSDKNGVTPLLMASFWRYPDIVRLLISYDIDVNYPNNEGNTPLLQAAGNGDLESVQLLISRKADVNRANYMGKTPLVAAEMCGGNNHGIPQLLIEHGADVNPLLLWAARMGKLTLVRSLIEEHGADVNFADQYGTPLTGASGRGHPAVVQLLIKHGADLRPVNKEGKTAREAAEAQGNHEIVQLIDQAAATNERLRLLAQQNKEYKEALAQDRARKEAIRRERRLAEQAQENEQTQRERARLARIKMFEQKK